MKYYPVRGIDSPYNDDDPIFYDESTSGLPGHFLYHCGAMFPKRKIAFTSPFINYDSYVISDNDNCPDEIMSSEHELYLRDRPGKLKRYYPGSQYPRITTIISGKNGEESH